MSRVLVIANNLQQASYRLRIAALAPLLKSNGIELDVQLRPRGLFARRRLLKRAADYDAVILQRKMLDPSDARLLRKHARKIFYDIDDALMFPQRPLDPIERWRLSRRFNATTCIIDHVVTGNQYLADIFKSKGKSTTIIPTTVDPADYHIKEHDSSDRPTLVWIGSQSTIPYLKDCLCALESAAKQVPGLRILVIADQTLQAQNIDVEFIRWSQDRQADALLRGDIGIAPTPTDPWTLGKCGFKIIQYMATGLPVIASPVGANAEIVVDNETGFLANSPEQWIARIRELASDSALRARFGNCARARVESNYTVHDAARQWTELLNAFST